MGRAEAVILMALFALPRWLREALIIGGMCGALLALAACAPRPPHLVMPPPEFDHAFDGLLIQHAWSAAVRPRGFWSMESRRGRACDVWIAAEVTPEVRHRLWTIERANCNGWARRDGDVNMRVF